MFLAVGLARLVEHLAERSHSLTRGQAVLISLRNRAGAGTTPIRGARVVALRPVSFLLGGVRPKPVFGPACGALAQLGEHLLCKQRVIGSIPIGSTMRRGLRKVGLRAGWVGSSGG